MDVDYVLLDLDGVVRHFDLDRMTRLAADHDLPFSALMAALSDHERLSRLVTGEMTRRRWVAEVGEQLENPAAVSAILDDRGLVSPAMRSLLGRLEQSQVPLMILTNGSDTVERDLMQLGVLHHFDRIFNSYDLGVAKPDPRIFHLVADALEADPGRIFFVDDARSNVEAAVAAGWCSSIYESPAGLEEQLVRLGVSA